MTEYIYEIWYDYFDGTQANLNGYQERVKVFADEEKAIAERDKLNKQLRENPYYIKKVELE